MSTTPNTARCLGSGSYEDGKWHWREGCDDCQRRYGWAGGWIEPPPIIAFECEYRIGPDENAAQGEHAPGPEPLSPAAQAVDHAIAARIYLLGEIAPSKQVAAAAIRALADQVVPEKSEPVTPDYPDSNQIEPFIEWLANKKIHSAILAIATELEALPYG